MRRRRKIIIHDMYEDVAFTQEPLNEVESLQINESHQKSKKESEQENLTVTPVENLMPLSKEETEGKKTISQPRNKFL